MNVCFISLHTVLILETVTLAPPPCPSKQMTAHTVWRKYVQCLMAGLCGVLHSGTVLVWSNFKDHTTIFQDLK